MLNEFDRHQMDAIVGEDPFKMDETPKWADCDKSVTNFDDKRPVSIGKSTKFPVKFHTYSSVWPPLPLLVHVIMSEINQN